MQTICSIHNTVLSCVSPSSYSSFVTGLKDFAPLGASLFSILIAGAALWVARSQKKINANAYRLNLFKERFAAYKKFQERYLLVPKDEHELISRLKEGEYPDISYLPVLEEIYLLFDRDRSIKELMNAIFYFRENKFFNIFNVDSLINEMEIENRKLYSFLEEKDTDLSDVVSDTYKKVLYYLYKEGVEGFPRHNDIFDFKKEWGKTEEYQRVVMWGGGGKSDVVTSLMRDSLLKHYINFHHKINNSIKNYRNIYTKECKEDEEYHYSIIVKEKLYLDTIKEMMERKLSLPSNPTDE